MRMADYWRKRRELEKAWARAVHECGGSSFCARVWLVACNKLEARRRGDGLQEDVFAIGENGELGPDADTENLARRLGDHDLTA